MKILLWQYKQLSSYDKANTEQFFALRWSIFADPVTYVHLRMSIIIFAFVLTLCMSLCVLLLYKLRILQQSIIQISDEDEPTITETATKDHVTAATEASTEELISQRITYEPVDSEGFHLKFDESKMLHSQLLWILHRHY